MTLNVLLPFPSQNSLTPVVGLIFETKNRAIFLERFFGNTPRFRTLLFGKEAVKTFFYKCSDSGVYESTPQPINGNKVVGAVMLLPKFLSEKSHRKIARFFVSKISPATGVRERTPMESNNPEESKIGWFYVPKNRVNSENWKLVCEHLNHLEISKDRPRME